MVDKEIENLKGLDISSGDISYDTIDT